MLLEGLVIQGRELPDGGGGCGQVQMNRVHGHFLQRMLMTLARKGACGLGGWERTGHAGAIGYIQQDRVYN